MVSLDKTPQTISYGRMRAATLARLRSNNLLTLSLEFGERAYLAHVAQHEARKAAVLGQGA
ncbi:hypothetical protein ABZ330_16625 [Streptomyces sp. NPDC006172]|uniref:hypothetical protein n=1 Tax=Streptomyces sp. NPDC006172 TaxID=3154470 RepID=UPI0033F13EBF